jgi:hypothetical protein
LADQAMPTLALHPQFHKTQQMKKIRENLREIEMSKNLCKIVGI